MIVFIDVLNVTHANDGTEIEDLELPFEAVPRVGEAIEISSANGYAESLGIDPGRYLVRSVVWRPRSFSPQGVVPTLRVERFDLSP